MEWDIMIQPEYWWHTPISVVVGRAISSILSILHVSKDYSYI